MEKEIKKQYNRMTIKIMIYFLSFIFFIISCKTLKVKSIKQDNIFKDRELLVGFLNYDKHKDTLICENKTFLHPDLGPLQNCIVYFGNIGDSTELNFPVRKNILTFSNEEKGMIETYEFSAGNLRFEETNLYSYDPNVKNWFNIKVNSKEYENGVLVDSINETFEKAYSLDLKMYKVNGRVYVNEEN